MDNLEKTRFMNKLTFNEEEIKNYPYNDRRTFVVWFFTEFEDCTEPLEVYAVNEESLFTYLKEKYDSEAISAVSEKIVDYLEIDLSDYL